MSPPPEAANPRVRGPLGIYWSLSEEGQQREWWWRHTACLVRASHSPLIPGTGSASPGPRPHRPALSRHSVTVTRARNLEQKPHPDSVLFCWDVAACSPESFKGMQLSDVLGSKENAAGDHICLSPGACLEQASSGLDRHTVHVTPQQGPRREGTAQAPSFLAPPALPRCVPLGGFSGEPWLQYRTPASHPLRVPSQSWKWRGAEMLRRWPSTCPLGPLKGRPPWSLPEHGRGPHLERPLSPGASLRDRPPP